MPRRFPFRLFAAIQGGDHVPDGELVPPVRVLARHGGVRTPRPPPRGCRLDRGSADPGERGRRGGCLPGDLPCASSQGIIGPGNVYRRLAPSCRGECRAQAQGQAHLEVQRGRDRVSPSQETADALEGAELAAIIQQELARLPDRYRLPVILCDLEGQSHADAAKALGWPVGSVSGRLSRARVILRDRLTRRGLAAPAALIVAASAPTSAASAATSIASGTLTASPAVQSLTEGVLSAMRTAKLKLAGLIIVATGLMGLGTAGTVYALAYAPSAQTAEQPMPKAARGGSEGEGRRSGGRGFHCVPGADGIGSGEG